MLTSGFFNSLDHDRKYDAIQMSSIFDGIISDGVFDNIGNAMIVKEAEGMTVNVDTGRAWFNHTWTLNDTLYNVEVPSANPVLTRIDALVLEVNRNTDVRANNFKIVRGVDDEFNPQRPTLTHDEYVDQYALAYITVHPLATHIVQADIANAVGTSETPFITGIIDTVNIDNLLLQWDSEFHIWENAQKSQYESWSAEQVATFESWSREREVYFYNWFENLRNQLDDNQAAHLQNQIDKIKETSSAFYYQSSEPINAEKNSVWIS